VGGAVGGFGRLLGLLVLVLSVPCSCLFSSAWTDARVT
jgi:hypothetical protein